MARYRDALPQMSGDLFLTDGGIETTLIFHDGLELPDFAAFDLLRAAGGRGGARASTSAPTPRSRGAIGTGLVLESATWRANPTGAARLGYTTELRSRSQPQAIAAPRGASARSTRAIPAPIVISGCVGPRGDGYVPGERDERGARRSATTPSRSRPSPAPAPTW